MDPLPPIKPPWVLGAWAPQWMLWFVVVVGTLLVALAIVAVVVQADGGQILRIILPLIAAGVSAATLRDRARSRAKREADELAERAALDQDDQNTH